MSELNEAAERLRKAIERYRSYRIALSAWQGGDGDQPDYDQMPEDTCEIADAYLAEHPADDEEPIDAYFLRACGFDGDGQMQKYGPGMRLGDIKVNHAWEWSWHNSWPFRELKTRGQLRRLAAALGIELTERAGRLSHPDVTS